MNERTVPVRTFWKRFEAVRFFSEAVDLLFKALILFVLAVLATGLVRLLWESWTVMLENDLKAAFGLTVTNLLSFFIILELFKSLVEYFREHRLKLTFIVDATLVFLLREIMVGLYQHQSSPWQLIALAALALVLGLLRTLAIVYSPMERRLVEQLREPRDGRTRSPEDDSETKIPEHALSVQ